MSSGSVIKFSQLCDVFEKIENQKTQQQRFKELKKFVDECRQKLIEITKSNVNSESSLFFILRLILPTLDRDRGPYGLKIKTLTDLYLRIFCIGRKTDEAQRIINYREPDDNVNRSSDFAKTVCFILRNRLPGRASIFTLEQMNHFLDDIAQKHEANQSKADALKEFILELNATELKWVTRIILKDMKLGITQKKVFEAFHPDAEKLFNVQSNLKQVCEKLTDPNVRINNGYEAKINIFSHFKPMLLERCGIEEIDKFFQDDEKRHFVQTKYDGERSQIHMKNGTFKYFTRQGFDITSKQLYGENQSSGGFLTKNISRLLNPDCRSIILDGELMGYHKAKKKFGSKGMNYDVKNMKDSSAHQPCFIAFDIILYNDELLVEKPYSERLDILANAFTEMEGVLLKCQTVTISSCKELIQLFNQRLDNDDEGLVIKKYDSTYKPNVREKSGCYKIKAEYSDNLINDVDAIILGGYYGEGKWSGLCNSFLMGIADPPLKKGEFPVTFQALVAVSSGFKHNILKELNEKFKKDWKKRRPTNIIGPKKESPNVWLNPKDSVIVQLRATEIIKSKDYPFGYTLRFPRVVAIRTDKPWYGVCTTTEFSSLIKTSNVIQKLTKRHATDDDVSAFASKKLPKISNSRSRRVTVDDNFLGINPNEVVRLTRLFNGKKVCVANGNDELSKHDIEKILCQHMANIVQNPKTDTFCVIAANPKTYYVKQIIQSQKYDVVNLDWLKRVTKKENWSKLQDFYPWELLSAKLETKNRLSQLYDNFYDSYTVDATEESLRRSFEKVEDYIKEDVNLVDMKEIDNELFDNGVSPYSIFRGIKAYFHESVQVEKYTFLFLNGTVLESLDDATYVFIDESIKDSDTISSFSNSATVVSSKWIDDCFMKKNLLPNEEYQIKK